MTSDVGAELARMREALDQLERRGASPAAIAEIRKRVHDIERHLGFNDDAIE